MQRDGAIGDGTGVLRPYIVGKFTLERFDFGPWVTQPESKGRRTASASASPIQGLATGIMPCFFPLSTIPPTGAGHLQETLSREIPAFGPPYAYRLDGAAPGSLCARYHTQGAGPIS